MRLERGIRRPVGSDFHTVVTKTGLSCSLGQVARFRLKPFADDGSAPFAIRWPFLGEAVVRHVVGFDAERVLDDLGCKLAVVTADCLFEKIGHVYALLL
jgi:hypothetical protein